MKQNIGKICPHQFIFRLFIMAAYRHINLAIGHKFSSYFIFFNLFIVWFIDFFRVIKGYHTDWWIEQWITPILALWGPRWRTICFIIGLLLFHFSQSQIWLVCHFFIVALLQSCNLTTLVLAQLFLIVNISFMHMSIRACLTCTCNIGLCRARTIWCNKCWAFTVCILLILDNGFFCFRHSAKENYI